MAENRQYINLVQDNGTVLISEDVIAAIVAQAIKDTDGVVSLNSRPGADIADIIGKNWGKGIKIVIAEDNSLTIHCQLLVGYDQSVVSLAKAVQDSVTAAVESMTGVKVTSVNVNVSGIVRQ